MNLRTNTNSNITFQTGGYTSPNSMTILGSGTRDVEIYTPLKTTGMQQLAVLLQLPEL